MSVDYAYKSINNTEKHDPKNIPELLEGKFDIITVRYQL